MLTKVAELVDPNSGKWDDQLLTDLFCEHDADIIRAIPLQEDLEDYWAWHPDPKGQFSVKSAYKLFRRDLLTTE